MGFFSKKKNLVGLDIGSGSVKAVEMKPGKGDTWQLTNVGVELLPQEAIVDGQIMDSTSVIDAIQRLFSENRIKTQDVATAISGSSVIVKKIQLPSMSDQELAESIHWEAEQYIPFDIQEVNLDYRVLDPGAPGGNMDILLVAAKKDKINDYQSVITQAGRNPVVMDVDSFALQYAYEMNYGVEAGRIVAMVNIGASQANINIVRGDTSIFTRDITTIGGNQFTDAIQKEMSVGFDQAENLKQGHGEAADSVAGILQTVSESVLMEVQKTFDFFKATTSEDRIDRVVLSGGSARIPGLAEAMSERFDSRVEIFNPFQTVTYNPKDFEAEFLEEVGPACAIGVGLAMRKPEEGINLLGTSEPAGGGVAMDAALGAGDVTERKGVLAGILIMGLAILVIGYQWFSATSAIQALDEEINQLRQEQARLAPIIVQVEEYQAKLAELEEKERLIERLKSDREGPVRMLDTLSGELPDFVWLTELSQRGPVVTIDGMAASLVSVADYIRKLEDSDWFQGVELINAEVNARQEQEFTEFQLRTQIVSPFAPPESPAAVPGAPAAAPAGAR